MQFGVDIPFIQHLGIELVRFDGGHSELRLQTRPEHCNSFAVAHGGVCMTLLDATMAAAARSVAKEMGVITIEMKTSFMQAARGVLSGRGRLMHRTGSMAFVEATLLDGESRPCAHATGTFKYVKRLSAGTDSARTPNVISTD